MMDRLPAVNANSKLESTTDRSQMSQLRPVEDIELWAAKQGYDLKQFSQTYSSSAKRYNVVIKPIARKFLPLI